MTPITITQQPRRNWLIFLSISLLILSENSVNAGNSCRLRLNVFDSADDCKSGEASPDSVGILMANQQCNAMRTISGSSDRLLGNYVAKCLSSGDVGIYQSGCTNADCSSSDGDSTCDREFDVSSMYARLSTPEYLVQGKDADTGSRSCFTLDSTDETLSITFYITGDCYACLADSDDVTVSQTDDAANNATAGDIDDDVVVDDDDANDTDDDAVPTIAPTSQSGVSPGTFSPISPVSSPTSPPPTPSPVAAYTPSPAVSSYKPNGDPVSGPSQPVAGDDDATSATLQPSVPDGSSPQAGPSPSASGADDDVTFDDDLQLTREPTKSPTAGVTSPEVANPSDEEDEKEGASLGVIVGSAVGVVALLSVVLLAGFFLGKRLQNNDKRGVDKDFEQSLAERMHRPPSQQQSTPNTSFMTPTDRFIEVRQDDEISMLEDPTIFTRDNTVSKMMREAEDQETIGELDANDYSLQGEGNTVDDGAAWSKSSL
ncbi:hypothetical protein MPSEU_000610500 [Mayamaea pseudoterrestris]|nr:hypothetical protein MPSEU_000610500 [Mayamaea pseudoterrestris]